MSPSETRADRRQRARQLTRDDVVEAAAEIVADGGYEALNMRAVAERCDVAITTLYRVVTTKEQLLGALADRLLVEITDPEPGPARSWEEEVVDVFRTANRVMREHPELAEITAKQHTNGRVGFATAERTIRALRTAGLEGEPAAIAFNALVAYTVGFTLRQLYTTANSIGERYAVAQDLPADEFQNVHANTHILIPRPSDAQFEQGLRAMIHGFTQEVHR